MSKHQQHLDNVKTQLDTVSPTFCIAKWKQVTMHLQNGHTHSCHHPPTHHVPIHEIKSNPTALHNTNYKKEQRKLMLDGVRPRECDYCWRVEDSGSNNYSDRVYKSSHQWAIPHLQEIKNTSWDSDVNPSYVEISFGNACNFRCSYCAPHISSSWMEEIERWGPYPTSDNYNNLEWISENNMMPIPNKDDNPYVDAFWRWWPTMYRDLTHFRITGGEPLLNKNTYRILDYVNDNPHPELELGINTNLNPTSELFDKFIAGVKEIVSGNKIKRVRLFTSAEAWGAQAEYIRWGMNYEQWLSNIRRVYSELPNIEFTIMSTYNILSLTSYTQFLHDILEIKREVGRRDSGLNHLLLDIPYLRYPQHQSLFIAEPYMIEWMLPQIQFMREHAEDRYSSKTTSRGFYVQEADKLQRTYDTAKNENKIMDAEQLKTHRANFIRFVDEHDRRRGSNFLTTFPQFATVYERWSNLL